MSEENKEQKPVRVGVSVLTNGKRRKQLQECLESFLASTSYPEMHLCVFDNGSTDDTREWLSSWDFDRFKTFKVETSEVDLGCAAGTNRAAEMVRDFEFVVHIESDFLALPESVTGEDKQWLERALAYMGASGVDYLYLRRMASPQEARVHWWSQWMPKAVQSHGSYMEVSEFWWSNNPHLRRNKAIYDVGCLPLDEAKDGPKGTAGWSKPEMEAKRPQKASIHRWGMFVHEVLPEGATGPSESCNGSPGAGPWCKYGFFLDGTQKWCETCRRELGLEDLPAHEMRAEIASVPPFTVLTVDNGWSYSEFERVTSSVPNCRRLLVAKGAAGVPSTKGIEVVAPEDLDKAIEQADAALFCKVGDANKKEYERILKAGVPMVVHVDHHQGLIDHQKNGFYYADEGWANYWLAQLRRYPELRDEVRQTWTEMGGRRDSMLTMAEVAKSCPSCAEKMKKQNIKAVKREVVEKELKPKVTVITPTWKRDPKIIRRAIDCMLLQTVPEWEQIVCSNGPEEMEARSVTEGVRDARVRYQFLGEEKPETDFGNSARKYMIEEARGEYIMFLDDDNVVLPEYVEKMVRLLDDNEAIGFAVCRVMHFGPLNEDILGKPPIVLEGNPVELYHIDPLQVMVRRELMQKVGWDIEKGYLSDGVTLERLGKAAKHAGLSDVLGVHM